MRTEYSRKRTAGRPALPDELLISVQKPARYLGNEIHAVYKTKEIPIRFAMCFPDVYEIGMSHLGIQILYEMFNRREDTWCERVFSPWTDMDRVLRDHRIPLFALESQDPVRDFDFLGITLQFELCYTNILQILDLSGIPLSASERSEKDPLVIGGGPCACNPEPVARFFDLFYIGEGETSYDALLDLYRAMKERGESRAAFLRAAAQIPGIYVPSLYEVTYKEDGTIARFSPLSQGARHPVTLTHESGEEHAQPEEILQPGKTLRLEETPQPNKPLRLEETPQPGEPLQPEETQQPGEPLQPDNVPRLDKALQPDKPLRLEETPQSEEILQADKTLQPEDLQREQKKEAGEIPARIRRQVAADLDDIAKAPYPVEPLVPFITVTQDRVAVELQRGCIRGCRFCQAGMIYRPNRERKLDTVQAYADSMLDSTGQDDILLSSLSSSDYSCIHEIVDYISDHREADRVKLQVPSLRIDAFSLDLMARVQDVRRSSLTFAPEAGSQRLRDVINKGITEEEILNGAREAFRGGWNKVKLYFMLGLPTETEEDRIAISDLANKISAAYYEEVPKEKRNGRCQITVSTSFFVPKPFTPFQWAPMFRAGDYLGFAATVNHAIYASHNHRSIRYSWHDAQMIYLEGVLARGDRRVADLIEEAYRLGAMFDCWLETWEYARWEQAAANVGLDLDFYAVREREKDEILPWDFIDVGVRREFLWSEWEKAHRGELTPNCREACSGCGAASYGCGVCLRRDKDSAEEREAHAASGGSVPARKPQTEAETAEEREAHAASGESVPARKPQTEAEPAEEQEAHAASGGSVPARKLQTEAETAEEREENAAPAEERNPQELCIRIRLRLAKYGFMKFIGHLELMRFLQKCLRRTEIDVHYSDGITPRMIMSTAMPLGLGLESTGEYVDLEIGTPVTEEHVLAQLQPLMPEGLEILGLRQVGEAVLEGGGTAKKPEKAMSVVAAAEYEVQFREGFTPPADWKRILAGFVGQKEIPWTKETKKGFRTLDMKPLIYYFSIGDHIYADDGSLRADDESFRMDDGSFRADDESFRADDGSFRADDESFRAEAGSGRRDDDNTRSCRGPAGRTACSRMEEARVRDLIRMCVCSRVGENLRPEQLIGEAFRREGLELPGDALRICRVDLYAEQVPGGQYIRQGDRRKSKEEKKALPAEAPTLTGGNPPGPDPAQDVGRNVGGNVGRKLVSLGEIGKKL